MQKRKEKRKYELDYKIVGNCFVCQGICYSHEADACLQAGLEALYCCDHIRLAIINTRERANEEPVNVYVGFEGAIMDRDLARNEGLKEGSRFYTEGLIGCVGVAT